jgi:hypothetical protein
MEHNIKESLKLRIFILGYDFFDDGFDVVRSVEWVKQGAYLSRSWFTLN